MFKKTKEDKGFKMKRDIMYTPEIVEEQTIKNVCSV